jgi:hypothetical protein
MVYGAESADHIGHRSSHKGFTKSILCFDGLNRFPLPPLTLQQAPLGRSTG